MAKIAIKYDNIVPYVGFFILWTNFRCTGQDKKPVREREILFLVDWPQCSETISRIAELRLWPSSLCFLHELRHRHTLWLLAVLVSPDFPTSNHGTDTKEDLENRLARCHCRWWQAMFLWHQRTVLMASTHCAYGIKAVFLWYQIIVFTGSRQRSCEVGSAVPNIVIL